MSRRNSVVVVLLVLLAVPSAMAGARPGVGLKGGITLANQDWTYGNDFNPGDRNSLTGFAFGGFVDFSLTPIVSLRPELLYVQKGSEQEFIRTNELGERIGTDTYQDKVDYLSVLITGKVQPSLLSGVDLYVLGGPRLDLKLSAESDVDSPEMNMIVDSYKDVVTGLTFGVGMARGIGPAAKFLLEFRYDLDLSDAMVLDNSVSDIYIENQSIAILAGIRF